jgi:hypothetical protein
MKTAAKVYLTNPSISFRQYFYGDDIMYAQKSLFDSKEIEIEGSESLEILADQNERTYRDIARVFGLSFSDSLKDKEAHWRGIVPSKFGIHVVVVDTTVAAKIAELNEVKSQVLKDFRRQKLISFRDSMLLDIKDRTDIVEIID